MTLRPIHALRYLSPEVRLVPQPRVARISRIHCVYTIPAGVRWRVALVAGIQTRPDQLLILAGRR